MDRKIELIQEEGTSNWHWVIMEYNNMAGCIILDVD